MKKTIIILTAIVCTAAMVSCEPDKPRQIAAHITEINYKGHRYLLYKDYRGNRGYGGLAHDPDCPCYKRRLRYGCDSM